MYQLYPLRQETDWCLVSYALRPLRVFVYKNLHNGAFSVRDVSTGKVIAHAKQLVLRDCVFKVSEAGRQRVIRDRQRNIHAGVEGDLVIDPYEIEEAMVKLRTRWPLDDSHYHRKVSYNPYHCASFTDEDGWHILTADVAWFVDGKVRIPPKE